MARECQPSTNSAKQANLFFPALNGSPCKCSKVDFGVCMQSQRRSPTLSVKHGRKQGSLVILRFTDEAVHFRLTQASFLSATNMLSTYSQPWCLCSSHSLEYHRHHQGKHHCSYISQMVRSNLLQ